MEFEVGAYNEHTQFKVLALGCRALKIFLVAWTKWRICIVSSECDSYWDMNLTQVN